MKINLVDNNIRQTDAVIYSREDISALFPIANKKISQLCSENDNLLVFPHSITAADDKVDDSPIFTLTNTDDADKVRITTGNVMGFLGIGNLQVKIKSRFDAGRDDYFLHYMLQRVMSFNLFDLNHNSEQEDVFDFLMFLFPYFLNNALRQGIYRQYKTFKHNDANVKGTINVGRHIARNVPFVGNVAYSTRGFSYDNDITQLIRHTIEFMKSKSYGRAVLEIDADTVDNVRCIMEHTHSYRKSDRGAIVSRNLRNKQHPYYTAYQPLQALCLQILRMEEIKYGDAEDEICGILFDGAWLWEEYVNTLLSKEGFKHPENKKHAGRIYLFEDRSGVRYPDFYKDGIVLDAKYKRLESCEKVSKVGRDDIHQMIAYTATMAAKRGGFIAPLTAPQQYIPQSKLRNQDTTLFLTGIQISTTATSYSHFTTQMHTHEQEFLKALRELWEA